MGLKESLKAIVPVIAAAVGVDNLYANNNDLQTNLVKTRNAAISSLQSTTTDSPGKAFNATNLTTAPWYCEQDQHAFMGGESGRRLEAELVYKITDTKVRCLQGVGITPNAVSFALPTALDDLLFDARSLSASVRLGTFKGFHEFVLLLKDRQSGRTRMYQGDKGVFIQTDENPFPQLDNVLPTLTDRETGAVLKQGFAGTLSVGAWGGLTLIPQDSDGDPVTVSAIGLTPGINIDVRPDPGVAGATSVAFMADQPGEYHVEVSAYDGKETNFYEGIVIVK